MILPPVTRHIWRGFLLFDAMLMGMIFLFLLYTDFSYFSTVFLMFTPCFILISFLSIMLSPIVLPDFIPVDHATPLMVARFLMLLSWFLLYWSCLPLSSPCLIMSSQVFLIDLRFPPGWLCFPPISSLFDHVSFLSSLVDIVIPCYPLLSPVFLLVDYVFLLILQVFLLDLIFLSCPHGFLRGILMRIATILWFVWFDDCLRLSVKLSFSVPLLPVLSLFFSSVLFISLFTAMMILCLSVSLILIRNNVLSEVSSVYYLCPLDLRMLSRDVFVFISTCPCHFSGMLL